VRRDGGAGWDRDVEDEYEVILEERFVVRGRGLERVVVGEVTALRAGSADRPQPSAKLQPAADSFSDMLGVWPPLDPSRPRPSFSGPFMRRATL
jgi:hypothetical protein